MVIFVFVAVVVVVVVVVFVAVAVELAPVGNTRTPIVRRAAPRMRVRSATPGTGSSISLSKRPAEGRERGGGRGVCV